VDGFEELRELSLRQGARVTLQRRLKDNCLIIIKELSLSADVEPHWGDPWFAGNAQGIVPVLEWRRLPGDRCWVSMPCADGVDGIPASSYVTSYTPASLQLRMKEEGPWSLEEVKRLALRLSGTLKRLHERGMSHRDVKPSNILFFNGEAMLADLDLVGPPGRFPQHYGTLGYIPMFGIGDQAGDFFALGRTLYELWTGNDRFEFPSLPTELLGGEKWGSKAIGFNRILLELCPSDPRRQKIRTADQLLNALARLNSPRPERRWLQAFWLLLALGAIVAALFSIEGLRQSESYQVVDQMPLPEIPSFSQDFPTEVEVPVDDITPFHPYLGSEPAGLAHPFGLAVGPHGEIYVSEIDNHRISHFRPGGYLRPLAGKASSTGVIDARGSAASFHTIFGIAMGPDDHLYALEYNRRLVRRVSLAGDVETLPALGEQAGALRSIALDSKGWIYVGDVARHCIWRGTRKGGWEVFVGVPGNEGRNDGPRLKSRLHYPAGLAVDVQDRLWIADQRNGLVRRVEADGSLVTIAGSPLKTGASSYGDALTVALGAPAALLCLPGGDVIIADETGHRLLRLTLSGQVEWLAGADPQFSPYSGRNGATYGVDGPVSIAQLNTPTSLAQDRDGNIYWTDFNGHAVRSLSPAGIVRTLAGREQESGSGAGPARSWVQWQLNGTNVPGAVWIDWPVGLPTVSGNYRLILSNLTGMAASPPVHFNVLAPESGMKANLPRPTWFKRRELSLMMDDYPLILGDFQKDWRRERFSASWRYLWNPSGLLEDGPSTYEALEPIDGRHWKVVADDKKSTAVSALNWIHLRISAKMAVPGGTQDGLSFYAILEFTVPDSAKVDGHLAIVESMAQVDSRSKDGISVTIFDEDGGLYGRSLISPGQTTGFDCALGAHAPGKRIYVAFGCNSNNVEDRLEFNFKIAQSSHKKHRNKL
jgi:serine/threonine protein kinase